MPWSAPGCSAGGVLATPASSLPRSAFMAVNGFLVTTAAALPSVHVADVLGSPVSVSVAVRFALEDALESPLAGVLPVLRHPFRSCDQIAVAGDDGVVEAVTLRERL
ncbi:MAG: hypothetical protein ACLGI3_11020 [Actinomycetes bacterium]